MVINWESIALFASVFVTLTAVQLKAFEWMLRRGFEAYAPQFESIEKRLGKLEIEVSEIRRDYIRRDDWLQQVAQLSMELKVLTTQVSVIQTIVSRTSNGGRNAPG